MKARLIGYTQPVDMIGIEDVQDLISFCARVSNPSNQMNMETTEKLLTYLTNHKHWSPFEMASATMEIETTRDIGRQIIRHPSFRFQEFSQRYEQPGELVNQFVYRDARLQDEKNRQNSFDLDPTNEEHQALKLAWIEQQQKVIETASAAYDWAISNGIAKEQARAVLPEGLTKTRMYMAGTIRSWIHYIELRSANGTQKEHIEIAKACAEAIKRIFPLAEKYVG